VSPDLGLNEGSDVIVEISMLPKLLRKGAEGVADLAHRPEPAASSLGGNEAMADLCDAQPKLQHRSSLRLCTQADYSWVPD